jgi:hypothetical protein
VLQRKGELEKNINDQNYGRGRNVGGWLVQLEKGGRKPKVEGKKNY